MRGEGVSPFIQVEGTILARLGALRAGSGARGQSCAVPGARHRPRVGLPMARYS